MLDYEGAGLKNQLTTRAGLAFELNIWEIRKDGTYLREKCRPSIFEIPTMPRVTRLFMPAYALGCTVINYDEPSEEMGGRVT